jgi:hypothetical protein
MLNIVKQPIEENPMSNPREYTNRLFEMLEDGMISYQKVVEMALAYMSESEVHDMMEKNELLIEDEEYDEDFWKMIDRDEVDRIYTECGV